MDLMEKKLMITIRDVFSKMKGRYSADNWKLFFKKANGDLKQNKLTEIKYTKVR